MVSVGCLGCQEPSAISQVGVRQYFLGSGERGPRVRQPSGSGHPPEALPSSGPWFYHLHRECLTLNLHAPPPCCALLCVCVHLFNYAVVKSKISGVEGPALGFQLRLVLVGALSPPSLCLRLPHLKHGYDWSALCTGSPPLPRVVK